MAPKQNNTKKTDEIKLSVVGHVRITSYSDSEGRDEIVHLDKRNACHKENLSLAIVRAMSGSSTGHIYTLNFGTGGATVNSLQSVVYSPPNVVGAADLNTPAYQEVVDPARGAPDGNSMTVRHVSGTTFSDIEIRCVMDKTEPAGQAVFDNATSVGQFTFDEMGLKTDDGLLLTHFTFNPVQKTANRIMNVIYTLRVSLT
jgi:hypothetical protein